MAHGDSSCPAGPRATSKLHKFLTSEDISKARAVFSRANVLFEPNVPRAYELLQCLADLEKGQNSTFCPTDDFSSHRMFAVDPGLTRIAAVLGANLAGRLTEESFLRWY